MPIMDTPIERIAMDFVGLLPWSVRGFPYILVIMDYTSHYSEVVPLRGMQLQRVAQALLQFFSRMGLPCSDQQRGHIHIFIPKAAVSTVGDESAIHFYLPPPDRRLVEQINQTLKDLLRKTPGALPAQWDKFLDSFCLRYRRPSQTSTRVAPFELVYG